MPPPPRPNSPIKAPIKAPIITSEEDKSKKLKRELRELKRSFQAISDEHEVTLKQIRLLKELGSSHTQALHALATVTETDLAGFSLDDLENLRETCQKLMSLIIKKERELLKETKKANKDLIDCKICLDREINTVLLECGHHCVCDICSIDLKHCPICKKDIIRIVKIFKS